MRHPLDYPPPPNQDNVSTPRRSRVLPTRFKRRDGFADFQYLRAGDSPINRSKAMKRDQYARDRSIASLTGMLRAEQYRDPKNRIIDDFAIWLADNCGGVLRKLAPFVKAVYDYFYERDDRDGWYLTWQRAALRYGRNTQNRGLDVLSNYWNLLRSRNSSRYLPDLSILENIANSDLADSQVLIKPYSEIDIRPLNT
jgi:hypothetical protein